MFRSKKIPSYRRHKSSGQAIVTLTDGTGRRRDVLLGKHGSAASRTEYARVIAEWEGAGRRLSVPATLADLTVTELIVRYWAHAKEYYRSPDGKHTSEVVGCRVSLRPLAHLYGDTSAKAFGPLAFKAVRNLISAGYEHPKFGPQPALARKVVNQRMGRIRRMYRWAVSNELVPGSVLHSLGSVEGLKEGRTDARETEPIKPVPDHMVDATLPHLNRHVRGIAELQRLTGARGGEILIMRACDIDMSGRAWIYRPTRHKNSYRGQARAIFLGPKAQDVIRPFLRLDTQAFLFSPRLAAEDRSAQRRADRKTPVQPSQQNRRKKKPRKGPGERYDACSYHRAIVEACDRAFPPPDGLAWRAGETKASWRARLTEAERESLAEWREAHRWHPHQLRHAAGTRIRKEYGIELARIILGHQHGFTTEIYAETDQEQAREVMGKIG